MTQIAHRIAELNKLYEEALKERNEAQAVITRKFAGIASGFVSKELTVTTSITH